MLRRCVIGLLLVTLLQPWMLFAPNQTSLLNSIEQRLLRVIAYSEKLMEQSVDSERISEEQKQYIEKILKELDDLRTRLTVSGLLLTKFKGRTIELLGIISKLETKLKELSESFENTVQPLKEALVIAENEIHRQKVKTVIWAIIVGVGAGVVGFAVGEIAK